MKYTVCGTMVPLWKLRGRVINVRNIFVQFYVGYGTTLVKPTEEVWRLERKETNQKRKRRNIRS